MCLSLSLMASQFVAENSLCQGPEMGFTIIREGLNNVYSNPS
jgi:hypothetical protein